MTWFVVGLIAGCILGRWYAWMKYHFPESQEMIAYKTSKIREKRIESEVNIERMRRELDEILRMRQED